MKEVNDGYQYVFLYQNDYTSSTNNQLFHTETLEHGVGYTKTSWGDQSFYFLTINLLDIEDDELFIRYGASGTWADTWKNRNIRLEFEFY